MFRSDPETLDLSFLQDVGTFYVDTTSIHTIDLSGLLEAQSITISDNSSLVELNAENLEQSHQLQIRNANLESLNLDSLNQIGDGLTLQQLGALTRIDLPNLSQVQSLYVEHLSLIHI